MLIFGDFFYYPLYQYNVNVVYFYPIMQILLNPHSPTRRYDETALSFLPGFLFEQLRLLHEEVCGAFAPFTKKNRDIHGKTCPTFKTVTLRLMC